MKSKQEQLNKVGIYLRLSRDDERAGESLSIENQRTRKLVNYRQNYNEAALHFSPEGRQTHRQLRK